MKIVLVHYHLRPGGVTQVVFHQANALRKAGEDVLILSGEQPPHSENWTGIPIAVVPALHYDRFRLPESAPAPGKAEPEKLAHSIEDAIRAHWPGSRADLIHVHNPLIRKNSLLIGALKKITEWVPLLLQNHDLAEDFRPDVYIDEEYPENCHYGVINSRDYDFLLKAGLTPQGLHLLPNEVRKLTITQGLPKNKFVYPVRGIRRKNIGEALFLSIYTGSDSAAPGTTIAITQPPTTEQDMPIYNHWKETAAKLKLPVEFEAGLCSSFADVMGRAKAVITTSVKEGFGFSFLEPWTADLAVIGRRIDYVCRDFEKAGVCMDKLYPVLNIPAEYAWPQELKEKTADGLKRLYAAFGLSVPSQIPGELDQVFNKDSYDFGIMDEEIQEKIITLAIQDKMVREQIKKNNPFLETLADWKSNPQEKPGHNGSRQALVEANREAVFSAYSREAILTTILAAYRKVLSPVNQSISRSRLLELYLDPQHLFLVGISPPEADSSNNNKQAIQQ